MKLDVDIVPEKDNPSDAAPICAFPELKQQLSIMGVNVGEAGIWRSVGTVDVLPEDIGERILFENDGIFYIDDDGVKRRGFMYKTSFFFEYKGETKSPKFHTCYCQAIRTFGRGAYRFANAEPVKIYSSNEEKEVEVEGIKLCEYCKRMLADKAAARVNDSTDFVEILKETGSAPPGECDVDIFGYPRNWEEISLAYRTKKNFTCERCGIRVDDFDHFYMHTHHKNGIKTDNRDSNLECLCIKCHSEVDNTHIHNFSSAASKVLIEEYMSKYK